MKQIVDKVARRAILQWRGELKDRIVFVHIPKCAGTALCDAVGACYKTLDVRSERSVVNVNARASINASKILHESTPVEDGFFDVLKMREELLAYFMSLDYVRFIHGHVCFSELLYEAFKDQFNFMTLLRNPVDRWVSFFFYNKYRDDGDWKITEADVHQFLESQRGHAQGHELVKKLYGVLETGIDYRCAESIRRAQENLHKFHTVGFVEHMDMLQTVFENRFGVHLRVAKTNKGPKSQSFKESIIDEKVLAIVREVCSPDMQLYNYALQHFLN